MHLKEYEISNKNRLHKDVKSVSMFQRSSRYNESQIRHSNRRLRFSDHQINPKAPKSAQHDLSFSLYQLRDLPHRFHSLKRFYGEFHHKLFP